VTLSAYGLAPTSIRSSILGHPRASHIVPLGTGAALSTLLASTASSLTTAALPYTHTQRSAKGKQGAPGAIVGTHADLIALMVATDRGYPPATGGARVIRDGCPPAKYEFPDLLDNAYRLEGEEDWDHDPWASRYQDGCEIDPLSWWDFYQWDV
jgi:hypothetical protein